LVRVSGVGDLADVVMLLHVQEDPDDEEEEKDPEVAILDRCCMRLYTAI
jgi:hypothetical protein